ncbi:MAG: hypothetical protein GY832_29180, partial [Chloroflexi bacterium]|nr:hypothetical protein [Chloroflexota bacterium]
MTKKPVIPWSPVPWPNPVFVIYPMPPGRSYKPPIIHIQTPECFLGKGGFLVDVGNPLLCAGEFIDMSSWPTRTPRYLGTVKYCENPEVSECQVCGPV